jgi:HAD superfamily hydrolase (TIGR01509 family)
VSSPALRMRVEAILLDFDGLILDTETPLLEEWQVVYARWGHPLGLDVWQHGLGTKDGFDPCAHLVALTGGNAFDPAALRREVRERYRRRCEAEPLRPGVEAVLREARALGLGTAVASSAPQAWVEGWLERHGIRPLFDCLCAREHVERVKPAPDLFLLAASRLGVAPASCVVFEDSPNGVKAARAAGMRCIVVPNDVTRPLPLPDPDLVVDSLAGQTLAALLERLEATPGGRQDQ